MPHLPTPSMLTVSLIYDSYETTQTSNGRGHIGASGIGGPCDRAIYYNFHWMTQARHTGRLLRLFETGNLAETRFVTELRRIGVTVQDVDPATGKQWEFRDASGHFGGSADGVAIGFPEAPKTWHIFEAKTHNAKSFADLQDKGVLLSKPAHWAQIQSYLFLSGLTRAFYLAVNKNTDELHQERIHADPIEGMRLVARAHRIIAAQSPPERISSDPTWFQCKWCDHAPVCHGGVLPPRHCRTCAWSTPVDGGKWHCERHDADLSLDMQRRGCDTHVYAPALVPGEQIDAAEDGSWIDYKMRDGSMWRDGA